MPKDCKGLVYKVIDGKRYWVKNDILIRDTSIEIIDQNGITHKSIMDCCVANDVDYKFACQYRCRVNKNADFKEIYEAYNNKCCCDHLGNKYDNVSSMCKRYSIKRGTYAKRIELGWDLKDALTKKAKNKNNSFDKAKKLGLSENYYRQLKYKYTESEIENFTYVGNNYIGKKVTVNGVEYPSIRIACDTLGVNKSSVRTRMRRFNMTFEEAVNFFINKDKTKKHYEKPSARIQLCGVWYKSQSDAIEKNGISASHVYKVQRDNNISFEKAFAIVLDKKEKRKCYDHLGQFFKSKKDMYFYYNIPESVVQGRLKIGWELGDALTVPVGCKNKNIF